MENIHEQNSVHTENSIKMASNLFTYPEILIFTNMHNVYKIQNKNYNSISQVVREIDMEEAEKPIYFTGTKNYSGYLFVAFENGKAAKISFTAYETETKRKKLKNAYNDESKLVFIEHIEKDIDLVAMTNIEKVALFNTSLINPVGSKTSKGVQVMKSKAGSHLKTVKRLNHVKLVDPEYYRKDAGLNIVGFYLKADDEI